MLAGALLAFLMTACGEQSATGTASQLAPVTMRPTSGVPFGCNSVDTCTGFVTDGSLVGETLKVCKMYPEGTVNPPAVVIQLNAVTLNTTPSPTSLSFLVQPNTCMRLWSNGSTGTPDQVTLTEVVPPGYVSSTQVSTIVRDGPKISGVEGPWIISHGPSVPNNSSVTVTIGGGDPIPGATVTFTNTPIPGGISNFVWEDLNANGIQDGGEPGIAGVTVTATSGAFTSSTTTGPTGEYFFTNLAPGTYTVTVATPAGFLVSPSNAGGNPANDSNGSGTTVVVAGNSNDTIDFGFYQLGSIGDFVWNDANENGIQDVGETGVAGVVVSLSGGGSTVTDATGFYSFANLTAGTYTVSYTMPLGYVASPVNAGGDPTKDSNASGTSVVISGNSNTTIDFGIHEPLGSRACAATQGYWKNHENKWPAPYSYGAQWLTAGHLTPTTWDALFNYSVTDGNSYMQLAHQWIAATLNRASGAPMSADVKTVLDLAGAWLLANTPAYGPVPNFKDAQAGAWALVLDEYNNGRMGTVACR